MARQRKHGLAVLLGVLSCLATIPMPRIAFAGNLEHAKSPDSEAGIPLEMPAVTDYLEGPIRVPSRTADARSADDSTGTTGTATPSHAANSQSIWGNGAAASAASVASSRKAAAHKSNAFKPFIESVEAPRVIEEGSFDADIPDPDLIDLTGSDLTDRLSISSGSANGGRLVNGVPFPEAPGFVLRSGDVYGTAETIAALRYAVAKVHQLYPSAPDLVMGDISRNGGGKLRPHVSHQSGRDVDVGYYFKHATRDFLSANRSNLDVERTWAFIEALLEEHKVEYIFIDYSVQAILYSYVKYELGAPAAYLEQVFSYRGGRNAVIRHASGHRNHIHVRFWSPIAVAAATGLDLRPNGDEDWDHLALSAFKRGSYVARDAFERYDWGSAPETETVKTWDSVLVAYKVRSGDTLSSIAKAHKVDAGDLRRWNGLKSDRLKAGQKLSIQHKRLVEVEVPVQVASARQPATPVYMGDDVAPDTAAAPVNTFAADDAAQGPVAQNVADQGSVAPGEEELIHDEVEDDSAGAQTVTGPVANAAGTSSTQVDGTASATDSTVASVNSESVASASISDFPETELDVMYVSHDDVKAALAMTGSSPDPAESMVEMRSVRAHTPAQDAVNTVASSAAPVETTEAQPSKAVENARTALAQSMAREQYRTVQRVRYATVGSGDNLWKIARAHDTTVDRLLELNGLSKKAALKPGAKLKVKVWDERIPVETGNAVKEKSASKPLCCGG